MKPSCSLLLFLLSGLLISAALLGGAAAQCDPNQLAVCAPAMLYGYSPSGQCCGALKQQQPCFCGYLRDPNLAPYISGDATQRLAAACSVAPPNC